MTSNVTSDIVTGSMEFPALSTPENSNVYVDPSERDGESVQVIDSWSPPINSFPDRLFSWEDPVFDFHVILPESRVSESS